MKTQETSTNQKSERNIDPEVTPKTIPQSAITLALIIWILTLIIYSLGFMETMPLYSINVFFTVIVFQAIISLALYLVNYLTGLLVKYKNVKVNYTRKINHFSLFFLPYFIVLFFNIPDDLRAITASLTGLLTILIYIRPIRERIPLLKTMYLGFDRPEDRPNTFFWLSTQILFISLIALFIYQILMSYGKIELWLIIILISGIGDGLAEPVGIRFGKHKYNVRALFSKNKYTRSVEGSLCVFLTSFLVTLAFFSSFTTLQFTIALISIPICMTLAEAFAPHTWDNPFLFLVGGGLLIVIVML